LMTLAFVGEPVTGQRPEDKCTPFVLLLASSNLMQTAVTNKSSQEEVTATTRYALRPALSDSTMQDHLLHLNTDFFSYVKRGDWARRGESLATPKRVIGDRAFRMRALLEKRVQTSTTRSSLSPSPPDVHTPSASATASPRVSPVNSPIGSFEPPETESLAGPHNEQCAAQHSQYAGDRVARLRKTFENAKPRTCISWESKGEHVQAASRLGHLVSKIQSMAAVETRELATPQETPNTGQSFFQTLSASFAAWNMKTENAVQEAGAQEAEETVGEETEISRAGSSRSEGSEVDGVSVEVPTSRFQVGDRGARLRSLFERSAHSQDFITVTVG